jgi:hypothetical protein
LPDQVLGSKLRLPSLTRASHLILGAFIAVASAVLTAPPSQAAGYSPCGTVVVRLDKYYWAVDSVEAIGVGCAGARHLARVWEQSALAGKIPTRVFSRRFQRYGSSYTLNGFACRHKTLGSDIADVLCHAGSRTVSWGYHHSLEPHEAASYPPTEPPRVCAGFVLGPDPVDIIDHLTALEASCATASDIARGSSQPGAPFDARLRYSRDGFACDGTFETPIGGGKGWIYYLCTAGARSVTFRHE